MQQVSTTASSLTTVTWAAGYSRLGWRVFPIWPGDKRPIYKGWQKDATTDPAMVQQYWAHAPDRNIGVVCGEKFDAWDIEADHLPAFTGWLKKNDYTLPEMPIAQTGRGGLHLLTEPTGVNGTRYLYLNGSHIGELKSSGGFIVIAPSTTVNQYAWQWAPRNMEVPAAPEWLLGLLERPKTGVRRFPTRLGTTADVVAVLGKLAHAVTSAGEGKRNSYLYWAMRRAIEEGVPVKHAAASLLTAGLDAGLTDHEVRATLRSAYEAEGKE